ncbi:MAG TPA: nucleotide exchange factor GrpE [Roseiflexaceae bacterium]|nr:nucleotide exchange factor GrpE [Roseiflexaceae bacterium]
MTDERMNTEDSNAAVEANDTAEAQTVNSDELQARIEQLEKEAAEYKDQWLRATADYRNFKRRTDQERAELIRSASAGLLLKLLPVVDDLERAMSSVTPDVENTQWYGGVKLIQQKLQTVLESEGVTPIEAVGQEFDPNLHEAVIYEEGDGNTTSVTAELQKGYKLRDRVLRPAMVKVGKS